MATQHGSPAVKALLCTALNGVWVCAEASQPEDWDEEEDGEWEAPKVANPKCKSAPGCGEWKRPTKSNPNYKGKWTAPLIDNPEYKVRLSSWGHCLCSTYLLYLVDVGLVACT